jgi:hypothetical protein
VRRTIVGVLAALLAPLLALTGCSSADSQGSATHDSPTATPSAVKTLTMLPAPTPTLSGTLTAELGQSSRDVALGRFQVWFTNGLDHGIFPRRIVYKDALLVRPVVGGRLRPMPSGSHRGYTLELIEPTCHGTETGASVTIEYGDHVTTLPVEDETSVVGRWSKEHCAELAIDKIAPLEWSPGIQVQGSGSDAIALFRLTARPTGRGGSYTIDTVGGTPLFTAADGAFWTVGKRVSGDGAVVNLRLPAHPARCDIHAFGSASGGTTFFVNLTIAGKGRESGPQQIRLAMSPAVTAEVFAYAAEACGF